MPLHGPYGAMVALLKKTHSVEEYLAREKELGVWTYPHFVRYLRALIPHLTPEPHHTVKRLLTALDDGSLAKPTPTALRALQSVPPNKKSPGQTARLVANAICNIIGYSIGFHGTADHRGGDERRRYYAARDLAMEVERAALVWLPPDVLHECSVLANTEGSVDDSRRDAACAAIAAGHFKLAHDIVTQEET